jgi:hypothetical protein
MNLFLVTSPLQYICALEAKQFFHCEKSILLLVNQKSEHGLDQQKKLIIKNEWDHIINIERRNRSFSIPKAIKQIKKHISDGSPLERFFYAEYNAWWTKLLIRNLPIKKEVYFDDGTLTLAEYPKLILPKTEFYRPRLVQDLVVRLNGCQPIGRLPQSDDLEIFTMFSLQTGHVTIHTNHLDRLKQHYGHPELYDEQAPIGFIGQGAVGDKNQKSVNEYLSELSSIAHKTKKMIIYFPHRTERNEIREALENTDYITYHRSEYPLEIELIDKGLQLSALIGTFSTVMFTCRLLYPDMPIYTLSNTHQDKVFQEELRRQLKTINVQNWSQYACS